MRSTHLSKDSDLHGLQMENELLTYEVRHLRARLDGRPSAVPGGGKSADQLAAERVRYQKLAAERLSELNATKQKLQRTHDDLVRLLTRLDRSPIGPLLRRRGAVRQLRERYGLTGRS
jgi:hypothetical protein